MGWVRPSLKIGCLSLQLLSVSMRITPLWILGAVRCLAVAGPCIPGRSTMRSCSLAMIAVATISLRIAGARPGGMLGMRYYIVCTRVGLGFMFHNSRTWNCRPLISRRISSPRENPSWIHSEFIGQLHLQYWSWFFIEPHDFFFFSSSLSSLLLFLLACLINSILPSQEWPLEIWSK